MPMAIQDFISLIDFSLYCVITRILFSNGSATTPLNAERKFVSLQASTAWASHSEAKANHMLTHVLLVEEPSDPQRLTEKITTFIVSSTSKLSLIQLSFTGHHFKALEIVYSKQQDASKGQASNQSAR